jgi:hypothetical protein
MLHMQPGRKNATPMSASPHAGAHLASGASAASLVVVARRTAPILSAVLAGASQQFLALSLMDSSSLRIATLMNAQEDMSAQDPATEHSKTRSSPSISESRLVNMLPH